MEQQKIYFARTLEEAVNLERAQEKLTPRFFLLCFIIRCYLVLTNPLLWMLQRLLFKNKGLREQEQKAIVVYTVGTVGDNVLLMPAVAAIKERYPKASLTVITNCDGFGEYAANAVWGGSEFVDRSLTLPTHPVQRRGGAMKITAPWNERIECDLFINLSPFGNRGWLGAVLKEMIFAKWLGAKAACGFQMSTYSRGTIFNRVQHRFVKNEARRSSTVLAQLGISAPHNTDLFRHDTQAKERVLGLISQHAREGQPLVVLNPGAKLRASYWPANRYGRLAAWLAEEYNACVFVNGTQDERDVCDTTVSSSGNVAVSLAGRLSIQELVELLRLSMLGVTNNTALMTLTAQMGKPTVVLCSTRFSPTFYMPCNDRNIWVFSFKDTSYSYDDSAKTADDLYAITVDDVKKAIGELLHEK